MKAVAQALQTVAATLWVGGLWMTGFVVAPLLFAHSPSRALAGLIAGKLFTVAAYVGIGCATYLIGYRIARYRAGAALQGVFWIVVAMLALTIAGEFGVQPILAALRDEALPREVMESVLRDRFATWHGVASGLFVIQSALGLVLVVLLGRGR